MDLFNSKSENPIPENILRIWVDDAYNILETDGIDETFIDIDYNMLVDYLIKYYEASEEYEKCSLLTKLIKEYNNQKKTKND
jgi:hypothetical protein